MQKKRTGRQGSWRVAARRGAALFLAGLAAWVIWLTADRQAVSDTLDGLLGNGDLAAGLVSGEVGIPVKDQKEDGLNWLEDLVVDQSALLSGSGGGKEKEPSDSPAPSESPLPSESPKPADSPEPSASPEPSPSSEPPAESRPTQSPEPEGPSGAVLSVVGKTGDYVNTRGVYYYSADGQSVDLSTLNLPCPDFSQEGPQILIVHTHTSEAYTPANSQESYAECGEWRTTDTYYNMYRVGEEVARVLREEGWEVIHDDGCHDYPNYNGAYTRSGETVAAWLERYPSIQIVLDIHRDAAVSSSGAVYRTSATVDGEQVAQVMLVMGSDAGGQSHPNWQDNLGLAVAVQSGLNADYPGLARTIILKLSRYNQQLTTGSLLVEIGSSGNTMDEALKAARYFALSLSSTLEYLDSLKN